MAFIPPYPPLAARGNVFHGTTAVGGVNIPASNSTSPTFGLWNPAGSGKNATLIQIKFGWVSTTGTPGAITYNLLTGAGSAIATAAPISAFTAGTPTNGIAGGAIAIASVMKFTPSAATLTTAAAIYGGSGLSQLTTTGATTGATYFTMVDRFDGLMIVAPGSFWYPTGTAAPGSVTTIELIWSEDPV